MPKLTLLLAALVMAVALTGCDWNMAGDEADMGTGANVMDAE